MICPECEGKTKVIDSRVVEENVFRKRECKECGKIIYTEETEIEDDVVRAYLSAIKREYRKAHKV